MANTATRSTQYLVVLDGQSFNVIPTAPNNFASQIMRYFPHVSFKNPSKSATSWDELYSRAPQEVWPEAARAATSILVMNGGTSDVGDGDSGSLIYSDQRAYAQAARAAGFDKIMTVTIIPYGGIAGSFETNRLAGNTQLKANADGAFDAVVDFAGDARLQDPTNLTYFQADQTHPCWPGGVGVEVELALPTLRQWIK